MMKIKTLVFILSMLLVTTGAMAQYRQSSKPRSSSSGTQNRRSSHNRSGNQNRSSRQNRSGSQNRASLCPDNKHPHMIDLGLPSGTKWACCNVDASKPEDYGGYYYWGETTTKSKNEWETYKYEYRDFGESICGTQYDVAHMKWGGSWQMPSFNQIEELLAECKSKWTTVNGVKGHRFTGPNGGSIFLPASGGRDITGLDGRGRYGNYWSGTQEDFYDRFAYILNLVSDGALWRGGDRGLGFPVRPVAK